MSPPPELHTKKKGRGEKKREIEKEKENRRMVRERRKEIKQV